MRTSQSDLSPARVRRGDFAAAIEAADDSSTVSGRVDSYSARVKRSVSFFKRFHSKKQYAAQSFAEEKKRQ